MSPSVCPSISDPARSARLKALALLDEPDALFQSLAEAAALVCETPIAMVSLADEHRFWFKARVGTTIGDMARDGTVCNHVLTNDEIVQIGDATRDDRFASHPLVTGPEQLRFYAGAPLRWSDGVVIGTLCVLDRTPRTLNSAQLAALQKLADSVIHALEARERAMAAVAAIDEARTRVAQLYRSTPIPLFSIDLEGHLLHVSDAFVEETGFLRDELLGRVVFDLLTPGSRERALEVGMVFLEKGRTERREYQAVRKDGTVIDILVSYVTERDESGHYVRTMGVFENITTSRRAERELRAESVLNTRIIEATDAGTWELDCRTHQTRSNERYAGIIGHTLEELGETTLNTWAGRVHPHDLARVEATIKDHMSGDSRSYDVEYRLRHKNGTWVWIHDHACVIERNAAGWPMTLHGVCTDITARKETEEALRASQAFLERVGRIAGVGGWEVDLKTREVSWSAETCRIHDRPTDFKPTLREALAHIAPQSRAAVEQALDEALGQVRPFDLELPMVTMEGRHFWARTICTVEYDAGVPVRLVGAIQDISARRQNAADLARSRQLLQVTLDSIADAVITTDNETRVQWLNPVAERITGWNKSEAVGKPLIEMFRIVDETTLEPIRDPASICLDRQMAVGRTGSTTLLARSGDFGIEHSASPIRDDAGAVHGAVLVFHDVSEQRRLANEMSHRATHDLLTGLFNRGEFETRLMRVLDGASSTADAHVLLYIDLDQFKLVNDACGHGAGDRLLRQVSVILSDCVRVQDSIARLGGDEFGLLLERCDLANAQKIAQKICDDMDAFRFTHETRRFRVGASIGLVAIDHRWSSVTELLQAADASCYAAKDGGRNRVHTWFDSDQVVEARHGDMQWVSRLELALDENRFELFAQRIESMAEPSRGLHFEVLLRLRERDGTLTLPGAFLPVAERFHLATRLDRWVVKKAFAWMREIDDGNGDGDDGERIRMMTINLSGQSLGDRAFQQDMLDLVRHAGFDVHKLCFEITETAAITHLTDARAFIERIRELGVRIALDDFGAGASSFGYLKSLPVDFLKIDGHFIRHMLDDRLNNVAVRCFCDVAKAVGVKTIAECVETQEVRDALRDIGVDMTQGYLFHRPEPLERLLACVTA